jgi:hypothetical protein
MHADAVTAADLAPFDNLHALAGLAASTLRNVWIW